MILPLASDGGCQLMLTVRGRPSLLTTVTSLGADVGTEEIKICNSEARLCLHRLFIIHGDNINRFVFLFIFFYNEIGVAAWENPFGQILICFSTSSGAYSSS